MVLSIDDRIRHKKREISRKQKEIDELKSDILHLEILKREIGIPEPVFEEEFFVVPKRILESYFESIL